ncbi:MAG TPA: TonB-dependent receptor [Caulobacteraceae bacterium]|nr:TonB-dependent receptor [Caulobacteraceae bacterium]
MTSASNLRSILIASASATTLGLLAAPAIAQDQPPPPAAQPPAPPSQQPAPQEVVVVAQHTVTKLQKIPVAVSVFTGAARDRVGIQTVQDVTNFAPGFTYDTVTVNAGMRGIVRQSFNVTDDSRVNAYEDEFFVYSPYNLAESSLFMAQEQIERGPQNVGGRPAEGGSIDMIAVRPTDHPYAELRATVGNYDSYEIEGAASDQIAPGLDARIVGNWNVQGQGFLKNVVGGPSEFHKINEWHIEGALDWKPSPNFELYARAFAAAWEPDEGDAGSRQTRQTGSWDEVQIDEPNAGVFGVDGSLYFNPNYGYAAIVPGAAAGAAGVAAAQAAAGEFPQELPIAATMKTPGIFNNPQAANPWHFAAVSPVRVSLRNFDDLNYIATYHLPNADIKYIGGIQGYDYTLDFDEQDTDITSFTLPGSAFGEQAAAVDNVFAPAIASALGIPPAGLPALEAQLTAALPAPSTLTVNPNVHDHFIENDWWTSHELSIQSTDSGPLQYIAGAYFYYQQYSNPITFTANQPNLTHPILLDPLAAAGFNPFAPGALVPAAANPHDLLALSAYQFETQSEGVYGQLSYKVTDQIKVTGNLRWSGDHKWGNQEARDVAFMGSATEPIFNTLIPLFGGATPAIDETTAVFCATGTPDTAANPNACNTGPLAKGVKSKGFINPATGIAQRALSGTDSELTGGVGIEWTPTPDIFTYARYSRGYAPLAFNAFSVGSSPEVGPEFLNSYEIGYKQTFGRKLSLDVAAFYYDYDQIQLPLTLSVNGVLVSQFISYPKAESTGVEVEGVWTPTRDLIFTLSYSFDYTALLTGCSGSVVSGVFVPTHNSVCVQNTSDPLGTGPGARDVNEAFAPGVQSVKGAPLPNAPRNKIAITGAYTWHFAPGNLTAAVTFVWRDTQLGNTVFNTPYNTAPSWDDVDLRATWSGDHDRYEIIGFVRNVFNSLQYTVGGGAAGYVGNATTGTSPASGLFYFPAYDLTQPRTFGVEVRYKFF